MTANLFARIAAAAEAAGAKPMIEADGRVLSYADMLEATARMATALARLGLNPGDRLVAATDKSPDAVLLYLASLRAGLAYVPVNTAVSADELAYFIADADPALVVVPPARGPEVTNVRVLTLASDGSGSWRDQWQAADAEAAIAERGPDDLAAIVYTSGTTGRSKGAMLSHDNLASNALALADIWRWRHDDVLLHMLPIHHVHGLFVALHQALLGGSTMLFHARFDGDAALADLPRASVFMGVPTYYVRLLDDPRLTPELCASMRLFLCGSAPLLPATFEAFAAKSGHRILERYGMTEAGMITSNPYDGDRLPGTVGYALPGVELRLRDEQGRPVAAGEPGILEMRGPNLFRGYWRNPEKTAQDMRVDGYFITGDVATIGPDGRVSIVGRAKDLIISGGVNIYPKEIELALDALPGVVESAVFGVPHKDFGEAVTAVIVGDADEAALLDDLAKTLARYKLPKRILRLDALPRNLMGKVQKAELRRSYESLYA